MKTNNLFLPMMWQLFYANMDINGNRQSRILQWSKMLLLAVFLMPVALWAQYNGGSGSSSSPYQIASKSQLDYLRTDVANGRVNGIHFKLTSDIDYGGAQFIPIGTNARPFNGTFDGGNFVVRNFYVYGSDNYNGFFGVTNGATISNLKLYPSYISGGNFSGSLIGEAKNNLTVINCHAVADGNRYGYAVGGLIGKLYQNTNGRSVLVENSSFYGDVTLKSSSESYFDYGGLIGYIMNGYSSVVLKDCFTRGTVTAEVNKNTIGGFIGAIHSSNVKLIRCVSATTIPTSGTNRGHLMGHITSGKTVNAISTYTTKGSSSTMKGTAYGTLTLTGNSGYSPNWGDVEYEYSRLERRNDDGSVKTEIQRGNERWGKGSTSSYPILTSTNYALQLTSGEGIKNISGNGYNASNRHYRLANLQLTVAHNLTPNLRQRVDFKFTGNYSPSSGSSYSASKNSAGNWLLTPRVDGTVSAKIIDVPYPLNFKAEFNQWTSKVTLSGTYNNPNGLTGKLYYYKRAGGSGGWARETDGQNVTTGSNRSFSKEINIATTDLEKNWEYCVMFVEGSATVPTEPMSSDYQFVRAVSSVSTVTAINLSDFIVESGEENVTVKFRVDYRLVNSAAYKYTIQSSLNSGAFTDWVKDENFKGTNNYYTHIDNRMSSSCDIYTYRLVVSAFGKTFTSEEKTGSKTGATKFDDTQLFKATKGEYADYVRLAWKVMKDDAGSPETYRIFRRVANGDDEFVELEVITSPSPTVYWNDNNALTGVLYEYRLVLYQVCAGVEKFSAERKDIGFTQAFGTVSGRTTYGTGSAVTGVNMLVRRNGLQEGESQYRSLLSENGGATF